MDGSGATAVVRFRAPDGGVVGHGVLVDEVHVVTCAHVVNAALGRSLHTAESAIGEVLRLEFPLLAKFMALPPERRARVDAWQGPGTVFDGLDVAGLTLVGEPRPVGAVSVPLADQERSEGDVLLFGPVEGRPGGWATAWLRPLVTRYRQQIDQRGRGAHVAQPRYSGTPVLDPKAERLLGILVAVATARDDPTVYSIPVSGLVAAWPAALAPLPASPYKGLRAFGSDDAHLFFGRDTVTDGLTAAVEAGGLVPVVGVSGAGKSSLVHAGLVPRLMAGRTDWRCVSIRPRPTLRTALAAGFARAAGACVPVPLPELDAWLSHLDLTGLTSAGERVLAATGAERLLLVIDQFEEAVDDALATHEVLRQLTELASRTGTSTVVVLTLREDAFGRLFARSGPFGEALRRTAQALRGMSADELAEVIVRPAGLHGIRVHERLVSRLASLVDGRPGALPLLEFALDRMWATLRRGQDVLSFEAYAEIGEHHGALAAYADGVLAALSSEERSVARQLFLNRLIAPDRPNAKRVAVRSEMLPSEWALAVRLANERLLTTGRVQSEETVEVVHEALLGAWGTLASWLKEEEPFRNWRRLLAYTMRRHRTESEPTALISGPLLTDSERWLEERPSDVTVAERRFISVSRERQDREERRYRTLFEASLARSLTTAAQRVEDPLISLLLAVEALERSAEPAVDRLVRSCLRRTGASELVQVPVPGYEDALRRAGNRVRLREWAAGHPGAGRDWRLGGEGAGVLVGESGSVRVVWPREDGERDVPLAAPAVIAACTDDASALCLGTEAGELHFYQITDSVREMWQVALPCPATCVAVDGRGGRIAVGCDDRVTRVLSAQPDGRQTMALPSPGCAEDVDFSPDGLALAVRTGRGRVVVWEIASGEQRCDVDVRMGDIAFSADSSHLVTRGPRTDGTDTVLRLPLHASRLAALAREVAGRRLTDGEWRQYVGIPLPVA
ncbi:hypothetical protein [Streptomyces sp. NPDC050504]|uniref:nSTAND1 domain-containing NTPase n=1 Tax=Streptomyces sp. NPDC050504 TaxID=3365618 RepID=UPI0037A126FC